MSGVNGLLEEKNDETILREKKRKRVVRILMSQIVVDQTMSLNVK